MRSSCRKKNCTYSFLKNCRCSFSKHCKTRAKRICTCSFFENCTCSFFPAAQDRVAIFFLRPGIALPAADPTMERKKPALAVFLCFFQGFQSTKRKSTNTCSLNFRKVAGARVKFLWPLPEQATVPVGILSRH